MGVTLRCFGTGYPRPRRGRRDSHPPQKGSQPTQKKNQELPPELVATYLLHRAVFIELQDLSLPVVDLKEIPVFIELDEEHKEEYEAFHDRLFNACKAAYAKGIKGAFSRFIPATINAVDRADLSQIVPVDEEEIRFNGFDSSYYTAKERELVRIVKGNLGEALGVFFTSPLHIQIDKQLPNRKKIH